MIESVHDKVQEAIDKSYKELDMEIVKEVEKITGMKAYDENGLINMDTFNTFKESHIIEVVNTREEIGKGYVTYTFEIRTREKGEFENE